jgi:hypothetical protein
MLLAHGGSGFPFFNACVYEYLCDKEIKYIVVNIDTVQDNDAHLFICEIRKKVF